jgi:trimethylamine--corrinoid protein Co-methyltransferase
MIYESVGMYASLMGFSPEGMVLGNDLIGQAQRCVRGIDVTEDALSLDVMKAVCLDGGPGHYLGSDQTLALMQTEYLYPEIGNRLTPKDWVEAGKPDLIEAARRRWTASCLGALSGACRMSTAPSARVSRSGSEQPQGKDGP